MQKQNEKVIPFSEDKEPLGIAPGVLAKRDIVKTSTWCPNPVSSLNLIWIQRSSHHQELGNQLQIEERQIDTPWPWVYKNDFFIWKLLFEAAKP